MPLRIKNDRKSGFLQLEIQKIETLKDREGMGQGWGQTTVNAWKLRINAINSPVIWA